MREVALEEKGAWEKAACRVILRGALLFGNRNFLSHIKAGESSCQSPKASMTHVLW